MSGDLQRPHSPKLVSLRTLVAEGAATFGWHSHPFEEFTLVTNDECMIGYPPGWRQTAPNTLLHYHPGEQHGAYSSPGQSPRFWVVHFVADSNIYPVSRRLTASDPANRVWALTEDQNDMFQWLFLQLLNEHAGGRSGREFAASAWLQLLLVNIDRWVSQPRQPVVPASSRASAEVIRLWHRINAAVAKPNEETREIFAAPSYDSVRHAFRKTFGCSPREMLQRLRMENAKNLLLESSLSIKEISLRVGYPQQHDFNRVFRRYVGVAPSKWRSDPLARSTKT